MRRRRSWEEEEELGGDGRMRWRSLEDEEEKELGG